MYRGPRQTSGPLRFLEPHPVYLTPLLDPDSLNLHWTLGLRPPRVPDAPTPHPVYLTWVLNRGVLHLEKPRGSLRSLVPHPPHSVTGLGPDSVLPSNRGPDLRSLGNLRSLDPQPLCSPGLWVPLLMRSRRNLGVGRLGPYLCPLRESKPRSITCLGVGFTPSLVHFRQVL